MAVTNTCPLRSGEHSNSGRVFAPVSADLPGANAESTGKGHWASTSTLPRAPHPWPLSCGSSRFTPPGWRGPHGDSAAGKQVPGDTGPRALRVSWEPRGGAGLRGLLRLRKGACSPRSSWWEWASRHPDGVCSSGSEEPVGSGAQAAPGAPRLFRCPVRGDFRVTPYSSSYV